MSKIKLFLVLAFVMVCAAGAGVGMIVDQRLRPIAPPLAHPHGPMDELKLTAEQSQKFGVIWAEVKKLRDKRYQERPELAKKRDSDILALLSPDQKAAYSKIQDSYRVSVKDSEDALRQAVQEAESETQAMLTPDQLTKYKAVRNRMGPPGLGRRGGPRNHEHEHDRNRGTSQPATVPANTTATTPSAS